MKTSSIYKETFFIILLLFTLQISASVDPKIQWEVIKTPHFEVVHDVRHFETAQFYALRLERNYQLLRGYFTDFPAKTTVVINDNTDSTNGYATYLPYPHIVLFPVLPETNTSISDYGDWAQELTLHEYTHILNFEPSHGIMGFFRSFLGSISSPNIFLPRWWHEGIAVEMETRFSKHGRLRSIYQDATLRALVKSDQLKKYSVASINETELETWPRGAHPYLFGSILLSEVQSQFPKPINNTLLQRFSRRLPYLFESPIFEETGKDIELWFELAKANLQSRALTQLDTIANSNKNQGPPFTPVVSHFLDSRSPRMSENGRYLAMIVKNQWGTTGLQIYDRGEANRAFDFNKDSYHSPKSPSQGFFRFLDLMSPEDAPPNGEINNLAWTPQSDQIIFDNIHPTSPFNTYSDLYSYKLTTKKMQALTKGLRVREPNISPSGKWITAIQLEQSSTRLVRAPFGSKIPSVEVLVSSAKGHRYSSPTFTDDTHILFVERDLQGHQWISDYNTQTRQTQKVETSALKIELIADLNREGQNILFTGVEGGLRNSYLTSNLFKTAQRLTHTDSASFDASVDSRRNLVFSAQMTDRGVAVGAHPLPEKPWPPLTASLKPLLADRYESAPKVSEETPEKSSDQDLEKTFSSHQPYNTLSYLVPRYWIPFFFFTGNGYGTQISTAGFDPLNKHSYTIELGNNSFNQETHLSLNYLNRTSRGSTLFRVGAQQQGLSLTGGSISNYQLGTLTTYNLAPEYTQHSIGWGLAAMSIQSTGSQNTSGTKIERAGFELAYNYDALNKSPFSPTPTSGLYFNLSHRNLFGVGTSKNQSRTQGQLTYFLSHPLPARHLTLFHAKAQHTEGEIRGVEYSFNDVLNLDQTFQSPRVSIRGYDQAYFYFRSARQFTWEYQLPLGGSWGLGVLPAFLKRSRLNVIADAGAFEGYAFDIENLSLVSTDLAHIFTSYGIEFKADFTLGYNIPITMFYALYQRPQYSGPDKTIGFIGIQL